MTTSASTAPLTVSAVDGVAAIERLSPEIDRLNLATARPNPFSSAAFLHCYALRSEYHTPGREERLLLVREGERLVGCVPMRRSIDRFGPSAGPVGLQGIRLQFLAPWDTEQPGVLSAPEDEERVARAVIRHLCDDDRGWGMLELVGQRPGGVLHRSAHAASDHRFRVRDIAVEPYTEIPLTWPDLASYFKSLNKKMRSNVSRQARRLYASGEPELILARGAAAASAWFEAYCDLDGRSWKSGTASSISRHPRRVRFYREIVAGRGGLDPSFIGVLLDGVLLAGLIVGANGTASPRHHGAWCLEMAYDRTRADLGPGQLLLLLAVGEALERGDKYLNFMQNFAYYKHRWGAEPIDVVNVQLIRRLSLHNGRASAGELRRWWLARKQAAAPAAGAPAGAPAEAEPEGERGAGEAGAAVAPADRERARALTTAALAQGGTGVRRLDRASARAHLPFDIE
jgi:hypothetical protein